jgi:hypothetical protein
VELIGDRKIRVAVNMIRSEGCQIEPYLTDFDKAGLSRASGDFGQGEAAVAWGA